MNLKKILGNSVVIYLSSRYLTYFIQFVTSLVIAAKLGPYHFGIWGFILLLLNYFQQCHFGIYNSMNVLYVQHREDVAQAHGYLVNSLMLECWLALFVVALYAVYRLTGIDAFGKYNADKYLLWVCCIGILQYFSNLFINVFRVKNHLILVAFCQSIVVLLTFVCIFIFTGEALIRALVFAYLAGNLAIVILALATRVVEFKGAAVSGSVQKEILRKGILLFLYNTGFYFIIISIRTVISGNYEVEEFGQFTFSFSLAHAVMLLLESLTFMIFPKVIGKLSSDNYEEVESTLKKYRALYVTTAHGLIYFALPLFPLVLHFFPKYAMCQVSLNLIALTILMDTSRSGYTELLIAHNKEKVLSVVTLIALAVNIALALILVKVVQCPFSYVILAAMVTYVFFSAMVAFQGTRLIGGKQGNLLLQVFPPRQFIPFLAALVLAVFELEYLLFIPFLLFLLLNFRYCKEILRQAGRILAKPKIVNL